MKDKDLAKEVMHSLTKELGLEEVGSGLRHGVLDLQPTLNPKSLAKLPYSINHKTLRQVVLLDSNDLRPVSPKSFSLNEFIN